MGTAGQLVVRRYRLVRALGQGSMGIVWEGHDTLLDRTVAVREVLLPSGLRENQRMGLAQRIAREARQAERLRHPNIAAIFDVAEEGGTPYLVIELVRSRSLDGVVASDGPLSPEKAASIARKILAALSYAHAAGVRHGDVRPANVLLSHDGRVLLADFGISTLAADPAFSREAMERSPAHGDPVSAIRGAAAFLAPERASGNAPTAAADLWALGATLHVAATGKPPPSATQSRTVELPAMPEALRAVVTGLLVRDPKKRLTPDAADRMMAVFEPVAAAPERSRSARRTRLITGVAAVAVLAGTLGGWALLRPEAAVTESRIPLASGGPTGTTPAASPTPSAGPAQPARLKLKWHRSEAGWRAAVPKDWTLEQTEYSLWWLDPEGRAQLNIEVTSQSGTDPLGALREAEAILYPNVKAYRELRLKSVSSAHGTAADWEFTWKQRKSSSETHLVKGVTYHQFRRVISTGTTTSVLTWTTVADDWDRLRPTLIKVFKLFGPPPQVP